MSQLCNKSFESQWGVVDGNDIHIDEYRNKYIGQIVTCRNGHILEFSDGKIRKAYFRHKNSGDVGGYPMTEWHAEWQSHFPNYEQDFLHKPTQIKQRRADVVLNPSKILEIQHSKYEKTEIDNRKHDYALHNVDIIWLVDGNNTINVIIQTDRTFLEFTSDYWKYESFTSYEYIFIDIDSKIYKVYPNKVNCHMIDVGKGREKVEFIDALKQDIDLWPNSGPLNQCKLFIKQQGAGNGKTYGIVRMLEDDDKKHYNQFIFITKQHSAKHIIKCEIENQQKDFQYLQNFNMAETSDKKKYIITYLNTLSNINCQVIISTLDAFTYSIGNKHHQDYDKFKGLIDSIIDGHIETKRDGTFRMGGITPKLNKKTLLVIDEFQDPAKHYAESIIKIMQDKYIDAFIVGDKLQSISNAENAFTYFSENEFAGITVEKIVPTNICRRFTHPEIVNFVNFMIPFENYNLPPITPSIEDTSNETEPALHWIDGDSIHIENKNENSKERITEKVCKIMEYFKKEAVDNNRFPQEFLIVTPFTKQNPLVDALTVSIQIFWKEKFTNDPEFMKRWNRDANVDNYYRYAIFHKSEDGTSIDLSESEYSTRIVSCHSAKGDGRNVVFVIGFTESAVKRYSRESNNLVYNSFLHVAFTRAKQKMYIWYENNGDDINKKINEYQCIIPHELDPTKQPNIEISNKIKYMDFMDNNTSKHFAHFYENIIKHANLPKLPENPNNNKRIVDMGNHMIRYSSLIVNIYLQIINKEMKHYNPAIKRQLLAVFKKVHGSIIKPTDTLKEFYSYLEVNKANQRNTKYTPILPVFKISNRGKDYIHYFNTICKHMERILWNLNGALEKGREIKLCPLECILLNYMSEIIDQGKYANVNVIDLYNIIDLYQDSFNDDMPGHENCQCETSIKHNRANIKQIDNMKTYLMSHFEKVNEIKNIMSIFHADYPNINWLIHHPIAYDSNCNYFEIHNKFDLIGYDDHTVIICYVKPQFNALNYNEILMHSILDTYFIKNVKYQKKEEEENKSNNYERFHGKKIITCVFSLELNKPYYMDWTDNEGIDLIFKNRSIILDAISKYIFEKYKLENNRMFYFYKYWREFCPEMDKSPSKFIRFLKKEINATKLTLSGFGKHMPTYINDFINQIEDRIDNFKGKEKKKKILKEYDNYVVFIKKINNKLEKSIQLYLNIDDDDDEDDDEEEEKDEDEEEDNYL